MIRIAIDGPSGAGKSFLARSVAARLGIVYVDTGALYRAIGLFACRAGLSLEACGEVAALLPRIALELCYTEAGQRVLLCGEDVSEQIRAPQISMYASAVSAVPAVRAFLLGTQREIAARESVVMDGRDIGTVILPDADVKIFLTATDEARAQRRYEELREKGVEVTYENVLSEMKLRDRNDSTRDIAPAVPARDAVLLDNSGFAPEDTLRAALRIISEKTGVTC